MSLNSSFGTLSCSFIWSNCPLSARFPSCWYAELGPRVSSYRALDAPKLISVRWFSLWLGWILGLLAKRSKVSQSWGAWPGPGSFWAWCLDAGVLSGSWQGKLEGCIGPGASDCLLLCSWDQETPGWVTQQCMGLDYTMTPTHLIVVSFFTSLVVQDLFWSFSSIVEL